MRLYIIAVLLVTLSYFQIIKILQLNFFNFFSPVILSLKETSVSVSEFSILMLNLDEVRRENSNLRMLVLDLQSMLAKNQLNELNLKEANLLKKSFENSEILRSRQVSIKKIIYYDAYGSMLILDNSDNEQVPDKSLVLIGDNIVGVVKRSHAKSIEVELISSEDLIINTQIINSQQFKIKTVLDYESGDNLVINNVLATEDVKSGDLVVTSNNNEFILPDLIIGRVQRIEGISSQTFRKAYIQKNYDLTIKSYVGVLIND